MKPPWSESVQFKELPWSKCADPGEAFFSTLRLGSGLHVTARVIRRRFHPTYQAYLDADGEEEEYLGFGRGERGEAKAWCERSMELRKGGMALREACAKAAGEIGRADDF